MNIKKPIYSPFWIGILVSALPWIGTASAENRECEEGPPVIAKMTHDPKEALTCLDSMTNDGNTRALVLSTIVENTPNGVRKETHAAFVVVGHLNPDGRTLNTIDHETPIKDPALFPNACGEYLKGGLILPGSSKIALIYAQAIRSVDYANEEKNSIQVLNDRRIPGMASTCEGYTPNWRGGHEDLTINPELKTLSLKITSRKEVEQPLEKKLSAKEIKFYQRAYSLECGGNSPEKKSPTCNDLKRASTEGVFVLRKKVRPIETIVMQY